MEGNKALDGSLPLLEPSALLALLRRIEWEGGGNDYPYACPDCSGLNRHAADCQVAATIAALEAASASVRGLSPEPSHPLNPEEIP